MNLINKKLLNQRIQSFESLSSEKKEIAMNLINGWQKALKDSNLDKTKEKSVQGKFLNTFFENILGYTDVTTGEIEWTLIQHPRIENDSMEPDGSLGWFTVDQHITRSVIELKDAKTSLDKKQTSRAGKLTPVEQAYLYATKYNGCNWIIVSNFKEIRLYNKYKNQEYFERINVLDLHTDEEFSKFYYLFSKNNLLSKNSESVIDQLVKDSTEAEQDITKMFYSDYKKVRLSLFNHFIENNADISQEVLLEKAQKLLDRFIFTLFCEDTSNLLPLNIVKNTYERAISSLLPSDERVWTEFKGLFLAIDKGNDRVKPPINAYNGGLFSFDIILDNLHIKDEFWQEMMILANYDFETDLNVNILGHIFEQSISDLESIKESIYLITENGDYLITEDGSKIILEQEDSKIIEKKGRRKKDGIFYTPEYITRYIVENTVGTYLEEYPDKIETIRILDPACGSGAFLNQAHSFLLNQYKILHEERLSNKNEDQLSFEDINIAETNKGILLNNLYGVDLNQESVEITKLALWLKTARRSEPLQNLDKNIKCGNSLIDDSLVVQKPFKWNNEFAEILNDGGFDVIIGNPPWGATINENEKNFLSRNYSTVEYQIDTYTLFIEKALGLLKENGYLGFIIPSTWLTMHYFKKIRKKLVEETKLKKAILFTYQVFENVTAETCIIICQKVNDSPSTNKYIQTAVLENEENLATVQYKNTNQQYWLENYENGFNLVYDEVKMRLAQKLLAQNISLGKIAKLTVGIKPYQTNKGVPKQTKDQVKQRIYDANIQKDHSYLRYIVGSNFHRYTITKPEQWIKFGIWLAEPRKSFNFSQKKILIRQTSDKIIATIDNEGLLNLNNVHNLIVSDSDYSLEYILTILNSSLIDFVYKFLVPESGRVFAEVKGISLNKLPIYKANIQEQLSLKNHALKIIDLNKSLQDLIQKFISFLLEEYEIIKPTHKLQKFYNLGWNEFVQELEKQKIKLNLSKKEELHQWFKIRQKEIQQFQNEIIAVDKQIDREIYKIYGLTEDDIKTIETSV